jgi:hypothetical protein
MAGPWSDPLFLQVCVLGVGGVLLGLLHLLVNKPGQRPVLLLTNLVLALVLTLAAATTALLSQSAGLWLPLAGLAGVCAVSGAVHSVCGGRLIAAIFARLLTPRWLGAALLLCSAILVLLTTLRVEEIPLVEAGRSTAGFGPDATDLELLASVHVCTDQGRPVPVYRSAKTPLPQTEARVQEAAMLQARSMSERLIRTAPPNPVYNCHGWTFTGGRYWVKGEDVARILQDNGYRPVASPRPNDLAIYRNIHGQIAHSGIVRAADDAGMILVESKWGTLSRYIHPADVQSYAPRCTYHRSQRLGHCLDGLDYPASRHSSPAPRLPSSHRSEPAHTR